MDWFFFSLIQRVLYVYLNINPSICFKFVDYLFILLRLSFEKYVLIILRKSFGDLLRADDALSFIWSLLQCLFLKLQSPIFLKTCWFT